MRAVIACLVLLGACMAGSAGAERQASWDYSTILAPQRYTSIEFKDLPGFTRSFYARNHALVTPESHVFAANPLWTNATTAHTISPVVGANFAMYLVSMKAASAGRAPGPGIERFLFVLDGVVEVSAGGRSVRLHANDYAYLPAGLDHAVASTDGAGLVMFERQYSVKGGKAEFQNGSTEAQPVLPVDGEVFQLRKLLPQTLDYDFNVHVMDFLPGEFLNVKEVHYNQHGLLLLQGQGIYRLGEAWFPIQAGDVIWMAPYVPQWYAALGATESRYLLYKDTTLDPLLGHGVDGI